MHTDESNSGRDIKPSARKSIHSGCTSCQSHKTMEKEGLRSKLSSPESGIDEIDNVMSKMSHSFTIPISYPNKIRRHSYGINDETDDDDSDKNVLSKSSPPTLLYYRAEWDSAIENIPERSMNHKSTSSYSYHSESAQYIESSSPKRPLQEKSKDSGSNKLFFLFLPIIVGVIYIYFKPSNESREVDVYDKHSFYNDVNDLGLKYRVSDNSIIKVKAGITTIFENQDTGSFIFTYDSKINNFNSMKFDQFIEDIALKASKYLRNDTKEVQHLVINPSNLIVQTEKEFMTEYQNDVHKGGVMLIKDVDNIPSHLAMAFHYYCDEYNPLVKKSAIFLTLNLAKCTNGSERKSTHDYVEKCLARKWNSVEDDKLGPLLTRVVNIVVDVTSIL